MHDYVKREYKFRQNNAEILNIKRRGLVKKMLSAVAWVPRGAARAEPVRLDEDIDESLEAIEGESVIGQKQFIKEKLAHEKRLLKLAQEKAASTKENTALPMDAEEEAFHQKYNLDNYDENEEASTGSNAEEDQVMAAGDTDDEEPAVKGSLIDRVFSDLNELNMGETDDEENSEDGDKLEDETNYLIGEPDDDSDFEEAEEKDDLIIRPSDYLLVGARVPEDEGDGIAQLEFYVYEENEDNIYVHHDIMLPSYPLSVEWIGGIKNQDLTKRNWTAVSTFEPEIEIWDLDVLDPVLPVMTLGKKSKKTSKLGHSDAVLCLSWNKMQPNLLASGSADTTIQLWDLNSNPICGKGVASLTGNIVSAIRSFQVHTDKVQCLAWNPRSPSLLASGAYDQYTCLFDVRTPDDALYYSLKGDAESLKWNPHNEHELAISDDSGVVHFLDTRKSYTKKSTKASRKGGAEPIFILEAHRKATTVVDFHPTIKGLFLTASLEKSFKIWDILPQHASTGVSNNETTVPVCLFTQSTATAPMGGKIFGAQFCHDHPCMIVLTGKTNEMPFIWKLDPSKLPKSLKKQEFAGDEDDMDMKASLDALQNLKDIILSKL